MTDDTAQAADWAFNYIANSFRTEIGYCGGSFLGIAYNTFGKHLDDAEDGKLFINSSTTPAIYLEKSADGYDLVMMWDDKEMLREEIGPEFHAGIEEYFV